MDKKDDQRKLKIVAITIKKRNPFLIVFFRITSNPLAIIIEEGIVRKTISTPFFLGTNKQNSIAITKFIISNCQFFLKRLFTDKAFGDLSSNPHKVKSKIALKLTIVNCSV